MQNIEKYEFSLYELQKVRYALDIVIELRRKDAEQTGDTEDELIKIKVEKMIENWGTESGKQYRIM